jgi:hypothetical protein
VVRKVTTAVTFEDCSLCFQGWSGLLCTLRIAQKGRMRGKVRIKRRPKHRRTLWITLLLFVLSSKRAANNITGCPFFSLSFLFLTRFVLVVLWMIIKKYIYIYYFKEFFLLILIQFSEVGVGSKHPKRNLAFIDNSKMTTDSFLG